MLTNDEGGAGEDRRRPAEPLVSLLAGRIGLEQLPPDLFAAYCTGYDDGRASLQPALDQAQAEADRLYGLAADSRANARTVTQLLQHEQALELRKRTA